MKRMSLIVCLLAMVLIGSTLAHAEVIRTSEVTSEVEDLGDGIFWYNYNVVNTSPPGPSGGPAESSGHGGALNADSMGFGVVNDAWPLIVDYEVPLDSPSVVWDITSPTGWSYEFISDAEYVVRFGEPNPLLAPYILHWYAEEIEGGFNEPIAPEGYNDEFGTNYPENDLDGFIFMSFLSPEDGPYLTSWHDEFSNIGDPPLPGGDVGGGGTPPFTPTPELSSGMLLLLGGIPVGMAWWRRKQT